MNHHLDNYLVKIILDLIILFEFSSDDIINSGAAVQAIEDIAYDLQMMDNLSKRAFIKILDEIIDQYPEEQKDFIRSIPTTLGIV